MSTLNEALSKCLYCGQEYMATCVLGDCGCRFQKKLEEIKAEIEALQKKK